jgi:hypothetical protein
VVNKLQERFDHIIQATFKTYLEHQERGTLDAIPHMTQALPALAEVNAPYNVPLLN